MTQERNVRRASELLALDILDSPEERAFDDITFIAAQACDAPIALISLLDQDRQWFKARVGLDVSETGIDQSICQIEIDRPALLEIRDLNADERTRDNALVAGSRALRYYAGAPLVMRSGAVVGRLCVIDTAPRPEGLGEAHRDLLLALARQVSDHLELRRIARISERVVELQDALIEVGEAIRRSASIGEMTYGAAAIVGRILNVDRAGYGAVDAGVETVMIEPDWTAPGVASIAGRHRFEDFGQIRDELRSGEPLVIEDVDTDARTADDPAPMRAVGIEALVNMPVRQRDRVVAVFIVNSARRRLWTREELWFLRSVADRLEAGVARFRSDQQQEMLNGEITHRLKNMLSMVQAIASQTLRAIPDREPVESFERRLLALSAAHDVLLRKSWEDADLGTVAGAVIETVGFTDRVHLDGPPVPLGARATLSFSLVIHELMTNACKYGSLCRPEGRVDLTWSVAEEDGRDTLLLHWRESGGPSVLPPTRRGFGSKLVRLGLVGTGGVDVRYDALGFQADFRAPLEDLAQA